MQLWIDKYSSEKFFDLLTDELTNRNVLTWLKTWDEVVFPSKPKVNFTIPQSMIRTNTTYVPSTMKGQINNTNNESKPHNNFF